jgi:hypothetical protein
LASKVMVAKRRERSGTCLKKPHRPKPGPFIRTREGPAPLTSQPHAAHPSVFPSTDAPFRVRTGRNERLPGGEK